MAAEVLHLDVAREICRAGAGIIIILLAFEIGVEKHFVLLTSVGAVVMLGGLLLAGRQKITIHTPLVGCLLVSLSLRLWLAEGGLVCADVARKPAYI